MSSIACQAMTTVLRAENVRFVRDRRALLDAVSLTVREGEHWALLGANGAGKPNTGLWPF